jgi:hypothetical protein
MRSEVETEKWESLMAWWVKQPSRGEVEWL